MLEYRTRSLFGRRSTIIWLTKLNHFNEDKPTRNGSRDTRLKSLEQCSFEKRCIVHDLVLTYKIVFRLVDDVQTSKFCRLRNNVTGRCYPYKYTPKPPPFFGRLVTADDQKIGLAGQADFFSSRRRRD